jgi:folate-binding protein YgfZ
MSKGTEQFAVVGSSYDAVRERAAGLIDLSSRGRLLLSGSEAVPFLNGLITNDMKTLAENSWMPAAFPNVQGRLIASVRVIRFADQANNIPVFLIDTEPATSELVLKTLARFTLAGDFKVTDLATDKASISLQGKDAEQFLRRTLGDEFAIIEPYRAHQGTWVDRELTAIRASHTAEDGFDFFVDANAASELWDEFIKSGAMPVDANVLETLRIEAGEPRYGVDMDETNVVSETNLDDAVSFTKGCYIGQEIIARIKYRGHVAKKLTGIKFDSEVNLDSGAKVLSVDDKEIGRVTSATFSPQLKSTIALGYVKFDYLAPGTRLKVVSGDQTAEAVVSDLPFIRGGWFAQK